MPGQTEAGDPLARLARLLTPLYTALAMLATLAGTAIVALIGASVTMRYFASAPFRFTEELVGLLMTAAFFLALPLVTLRAGHVRILIVATNLTGRAATAARILAALLGTAFCLWFFALGLPWFEFAYSRAIRTEVGRLLMYPWMALLPLSMILTALAFIARVAGDPPAEQG